MISLVWVSTAGALNSRRTIRETGLLSAVALKVILADNLRQPGSHKR